MRCGCVCALVLSTVLVSPASADTLRQFKVGNWVAGAYSPPNTKEFSHCAGGTAYNSGVIMMFTVAKNFRWNVGFASRQWRLTKDGIYDIAFAIDGGQPHYGKATAIAHDHVRVDLADDIELFAKFKRGYTLRVAAGNQVLTFNLTGTSALLPALLDCVRDELGRTRVAGSNPFVPSQRQNSRGSGDPRPNPAHQAEATALLSNIMSAAGITGFTVGSPEEATERKGDAVWAVSKNLFGKVVIVPTGTFAEFQDVWSEVIGEAHQKCKGAFLSGSLPDEAGGKSFRIFTSCQQGKNSTTTYYLATLRLKGGVYVFTTISLGSDRPAKEADASIRSAVLRQPN